MNLFQMHPDAIASEIKAFNDQLGVGVKNLLTMGELSNGVTPYEVVFSEDHLRLLHYKRSDQGLEPLERNPVPLLIVYALVNRPYMTDLQEHRSTIKGLLDAGQDVYLIDWGYPDAADRYLTLDDYLNGYLDDCVEHICAAYGLKRINLLGICQGGTFSLCYSALHPHKVKNLVTMVTPVDFQTPDNMLSHWVQQVDVDLLVDTLGNVPGEMLNGLFLNLKPYQLMGQKYLGLVDIMSDQAVLKNFMRMEKWIFDSPDQAGEAFRQFIKDFFQQNKLIKGGLEIGGQPVDLGKIIIPVLNIYADQDHLVPPAASMALRGCVGSTDYSEVSFDGGHIGIYVSGKAQKTIPPAIGAWLNERA